MALNLASPPLCLTLYERLRGELTWFGTLQLKRQHLSVKPLLNPHWAALDITSKPLEYSGNRKHVKHFLQRLIETWASLVSQKKPGSSLRECSITSQASPGSLPAEQTGKVIHDVTFLKQLWCCVFFPTLISFCIFLDHKARCACFCIQLPKLLRKKMLQLRTSGFLFSLAFRPVQHPVLN